MTGMSAGASPPCPRRYSATARPLFLPTAIAIAQHERLAREFGGGPVTPGALLLEEGTGRDLRRQHLHDRSHELVRQVVVRQEAFEVVAVVLAEQASAIDGERASREVAGVAVALATAAVPVVVQVAAVLRPDCRGRDREQREADQQARYRGHRAPRGRGKLGWLMGFEPTTTGITIRDSTPELQPPPRKPVRPAWEAGVVCAPLPGSGAPDRTRTCYPRLRRPVLYPNELRAPVGRGERLRHVDDRSNASAPALGWSGWRDLNSRHLAPKASALPGCATPRGARLCHSRPSRANIGLRQSASLQPRRGARRHAPVPVAATRRTCGSRASPRRSPARPRPDFTACCTQPCRWCSSNSSAERVERRAHRRSPASGCRRSSGPRRASCRCRAPGLRCGSGASPARRDARPRAARSDGRAPRARDARRRPDGRGGRALRRPRPRRHSRRPRSRTRAPAP